MHILLLILTSLIAVANGTEATRGHAKAQMARPATFPHRIWAACDFESRQPDYAWFGEAKTNNIPPYPGNRTALEATGERLVVGVNPVPGPRMGAANLLYVRYRSSGTEGATFQYFSLTTKDNNHIKVTGLAQDGWAEVTLNSTRDGLRNDGTPGVPFKEGERMDDLKIFPAAGAGNVRFTIDDVILFANDPQRAPEPEPFPRRVIHLAAFDTGPKEQYWPGDFDIVEHNLPADSFWRVARAVPRKDGNGKLVSLPINPVKPVGDKTKLRFRYHLSGTNGMTVQIFDATVQDNRHIELRDLKTNSWETLYLDFTRDSKRNDGSKDLFKAGNVVDDIFFFVGDRSSKEAVELLLDEVVLYDAY